jgi:hypothetical protein
MLPPFNLAADGVAGSDALASLALQASAPFRASRTHGFPLQCERFCSRDANAEFVPQHARATVRSSALPVPERGVHCQGRRRLVGRRGRARGAPGPAACPARRFAVCLGRLAAIRLVRAIRGRADDLRLGAGRARRRTLHAVRRSRSRWSPSRCLLAVRMPSANPEADGSRLASAGTPRTARTASQRRAAICPMSRDVTCAGRTRSALGRLSCSLEPSHVPSSSRAGLRALAPRCATTLRRLRRATPEARQWSPPEGPLPPCSAAAHQVSLISLGTCTRGRHDGRCG